jgi:hypothetical protein
MLFKRGDKVRVKGICSNATRTCVSNGRCIFNDKVGTFNKLEESGKIYVDNFVPVGSYTCCSGFEEHMLYQAIKEIQVYGIVKFLEGIKNDLA